MPVAGTPVLSLMAVVSQGPIQEYVRTSFKLSHGEGFCLGPVMLGLVIISHISLSRLFFHCNGFVLELLHRGGRRCISLREGAGVDRCWGNWPYICLGVMH